MKTRTLIFLSLLFNCMLNAQNFSIPGNGQTTPMYKNSSWTGTGGSIPYGTKYRIDISTTSPVSIAAYLIIDGVKYTNNSIYEPPQNAIGYADVKTYYGVPNNATCGLLGEVKIKLTDVSTTFTTSFISTGYILIVKPSIIGTPFEFCTNNPNNFLLDFPCGATSSTISISKTGWKINGQSSPITITGNTFTVSPPSYADVATISITGTQWCAPATYTLVHSLLLPSNPSNLTYQAINSQSCFFKVNTSTINNTYYYEWADNSGFLNTNLTTTNSTLYASNNQFEQNTSMQVWVRGRNGCGLSTNCFSKLLNFPGLPNCLPSKVNDLNFDEPKMNSNATNTEEVIVYKFPDSEMLIICLPEENQTAIVNCYDLSGNLFDSFEATGTKTEHFMKFKKFNNKFIVVQVIGNNIQYSKKISVK